MKCTFGDIEINTKFDTDQRIWYVQDFPNSVGISNFQVVEAVVGEIVFRLQLNSVSYSYRFFNTSLFTKRTFLDSDLYSTEEEAKIVAQTRQEKWTEKFLENSISTNRH